MPRRLFLGRSRFPSAFCGLIALVAALCGCKADRRPVIVLAAASLSRAMADLEQQLEQRRSDLDLRIEISGSQTACRKVAELSHRADVVLVADYRVIDTICRPGGHASYTIHFATNAVVLAHMEHSRHTDEITARNWPSILMRPRVRLGLVSPDTAPIGYRTLLVWKLAALGTDGTGAPDPKLAQQLLAKVAPENIVPHEMELLQQLQARAIDYAFVYQSTAEEHNLKVVPLPASINLGDPGNSARYARAAVEVRMGRAGEKTTIPGAPVVYGLTIPEAPPNPAGALAVVSALLSDEGRRILRRTGFTPFSPARCDEADRLPSALRSLVRGPVHRGTRRQRP